jgi:hypothetical protein
LPNNNYRIWLIGAIYGFLLISGVLPLVILGWVVTSLAPALTEPAFGRGLVQAGGQILSLATAVLGAFLHGLGGLAQQMAQQQTTIGWLMVMVGIVFLWGGVYRQLTGSTRV